MHSLSQIANSLFTLVSWLQLTDPLLFVSSRVPGVLASVITDFSVTDNWWVFCVCRQFVDNLLAPVCVCAPLCVLVSVCATHPNELILTQTKNTHCLHSFHRHIIVAPPVSFNPQRFATAYMVGDVSFEECHDFDAEAPSQIHLIPRVSCLALTLPCYVLPGAFSSCFFFSICSVVHATEGGPCPLD